MRLFTIAGKDFYQFLKKWQTFLFLLVMPLAFMMLFGKAFSGSAADDRPSVLVLDEDHGAASSMLLHQLETSDALYITQFDGDSVSLQQQVKDGKADAGLWVQSGMDDALMQGEKFSGVVWYAGSNVVKEQTALAEVQRLTRRVNASAVIAWASMQGSTAGNQTAFRTGMNKLEAAWQAFSGFQVRQTFKAQNPYSQSAPGMMLQFAVAGLTGLATILVLEKNGRTEDRMRMSSVPAWEVMLGHYLAMVMMLGSQFVILLVFGQLALGLDYLHAWPASLVLSLVTVLCISAMGLLIGVVSKHEEQTVMYALMAMFLFSALGGLWMPLDVTGAAFQTIGHFTPLAWAMDGYKGILNQGANLAAIGQSVWVLGAYTLGMIVLTIWIYQRQKVK